jgi:hypothetical protein
MYNKEGIYKWRYNNIDKYNEYVRQHMQKNYDTQKRREKYLREKERKLLKQQEINNINNLI